MPVPTAGDFIGPIAVPPLAPGVALEMVDLEFVSENENFQLLIPTIRAGTLNRLHSSGFCAGRTKQLGHVEPEHIRSEFDSHFYFHVIHRCFVLDMNLFFQL
ncbi:hypothetical protein RvY_04081 [Ramazzottius varieornatus]|uniref:Uncharacterized protein n=1 Tax=Ramazzottius varieornatus TaxID=947166 RepID=A0A1D1UTW7_RAMVA|nr:hypothetical protein RvY_04081 [Ramazzottius varieornatus]